MKLRPRSPPFRYLDRLPAPPGAPPLPPHATHQAVCHGVGLAETLIEALRVGFALLETIAREVARTGWSRAALARQQQHAANRARAKGLLDGAIHCLFALVDGHAAAKRSVLAHLSELVDAQARTDGVSRGSTTARKSSNVSAGLEMSTVAESAPMTWPV